MTIRLFSVLLALLALSCAPSQRPLSSGERQALNQMSADIVGDWSCDEGGKGAFSRTFFPNGSGTMELLNLEIGRDGKCTEVLLDLSAQLTWHIEQEDVYPILVTELGKVDVLVLEIEVGGRKLSRNREAVELIKAPLVGEFEGKVFRNKILRLDEAQLAFLDGKKRSFCLR